MNIQISKIVHIMRFLSSFRNVKNYQKYDSIVKLEYF